MERITSRRNEKLQHLKKLASSAAYRRACGQFLCDGEKLLREALEYGASVVTVLSAGELSLPLPKSVVHLTADQELLDFVSPLKTPQNVLFSCRIPPEDASSVSGRIVVLDGVQDPGNVGAVIRAAGAFCFDAVVLTGGCADVYNPKTVRATMGAVFRQRVVTIDHSDLAALCRNGLRLTGAALHRDSVPLHLADLSGRAVVIGSEGAGISPEVLALCESTVEIPMSARCESLNAATAAGILLWEVYRRETLQGGNDSGRA